MSSHHMLCDAIKHSTGAQLNALYDNARVRVYQDEYRWQELTVLVEFTHRGKSFGFGESFPVDYFYRDNRFYDEYIREQFPRRIAQEAAALIMRGAL